jgi:sugar phosphate isomerase/epimerase
VSLAAGSLRDVPRLEAVTAAAGAGFGAVGLRFDIDPPTASELAALSRRLDDAGLGVLDVEVVRLSPQWDLDLEQRLVDQAHAVGARHLLVVSDDRDRARSIDGLSRVAGRCREAGLKAVLEFMRFTHPSTLAEAVEWVDAAGEDVGGVLVDALHLARSGGRPDDVGAHAGARFPYLQLCDGPAVCGDESVSGLIQEARHARLLPGQGALPLAELVSNFDPSTPLSIEVQSDALEAALAAPDRARRMMAATRAFIG